MKKIVLCGAISVVVLLLIAGYWISETSVGVKGTDSIERADARQHEEIDSRTEVKDSMTDQTDFPPTSGPFEKQNASEQPDVANPTPESLESGEISAAQWSIEAARWNRDAGYPSSEDFDAYNGLKVDELASLAERGDYVAAYRAGIMLAAAGREAEARNLLFASVADGSIAAAAALRDMYAGWYDVPRDKAESEAWRQVALAMGQPPLATGSLTADEATLAGHLFGIYWREINARYMRDHGVTLPFRPFPLPPESPDPEG